MDMVWSIDYQRIWGIYLPDWENDVSEYEYLDYPSFYTGESRTDGLVDNDSTKYCEINYKIAKANF
jgi:hypothetical protein